MTPSQLRQRFGDSAKRERAMRVVIYGEKPSVTTPSQSATALSPREVRYRYTGQRNLRTHQRGNFRQK